MQACQTNTEYIIDPAFEEYVSIFELEAFNRDVDVNVSALAINIEFASLEPRNLLGQCLTYSNESRTITIDKEIWSVLDDYEKEYLMFHELGHCVLGKDHFNGSNQNGICLSIMQDGSGSCSVIYNASNRNELLNELFNL